MSLVNDMLRDLEARRAAPTERERDRKSVV